MLESHDHDTVFQLAGVAAARRSLAGVSLPGLDVALVGDDQLVTAEASTDDGRVLASGVAAYADDWVGFRTIEVDPAERGRRLGLLVMAELLEWGAERGATTAYLQVLGDNTRAHSRCTTGSASPSTTGTATWPRPGKEFLVRDVRP